MNYVEESTIGFGNGFIYILVAGMWNYDDDEATRVIAAYQDEEEAKEHLEKLNEFGKKLDLEMSRTWDHAAILNPYDPCCCNSESSPEYEMVAIPLSGLANLQSMHQRAKEDLTIRCIRCGKVGGGKYPHTHQSFVRQFKTYNWKKDGFVCSECEWNDKNEAETKRYAKS